MSADTNEGQERKFKRIGTRPIRHDGLDKVTGRARFGADYAGITSASGVIGNGTATCSAEGTGYVELVEAEPGVLLIMFDRFPFAPMMEGNCTSAPPTPGCAAPNHGGPPGQTSRGRCCHLDAPHYILYG